MLVWLWNAISGFDDSVDKFCSETFISGWECVDAENVKHLQFNWIALCSYSIKQLYFVKQSPTVIKDFTRTTNHWNFSVKE